MKSNKRKYRGFVVAAAVSLAGWQAFGIFKNQGDCVSFVATDGRNPPAN